MKKLLLAILISIFALSNSYSQSRNSFTVAFDSLHKKKTNWVNLEKKLRDQQIGGSYGFTLIKLDDGRFVVRLLTTGSPADLAGIKFGAEILEVNDKPTTEAINSVSVIWAEQIPATKEGKQLHQCRLIGRAPVGANMKIKNIKGLVLDLRINTGGADAFAAAVAGCFYSDTTHYEYESYYDPATSTFQRSKDFLTYLSFQTASYYQTSKHPRGSLYIEP